MKRLTLVIICCFLFVLSGCSKKFQRISFDSDTLGEALTQYVDADTMVEATLEESFPSQFPVYEISTREISEEEFQQMMQNLGIEDMGTSAHRFKLHGNKISGSLVSITDTTRGYFDMTEEELEDLAWETFEKLPFMDGTYEYLGIKSTTTISDAEGTHITRAGVSFRRLLGDVRVVGSDQCYLYFDGTGLVELNIELYAYKETGSMDMVTLESAFNRIKNPDAFSVTTENDAQVLGAIDALRVEQIKLLYVNQYNQGCTILQPVYNFIGTATDENGEQAEFQSIVIAIPESYTYEVPDTK